MKKKKWELPKFLTTELMLHEKRMDNAIRWVEENRKEIHPSISFNDAMVIYNMGIDVTQIKPKILIK